MQGTAHASYYAARSVRSNRLPQRLSSQWRWWLAGGDAAVILFVSLVVLSGEGNPVPAAVVTCGIIMAIFWQCGFYRRTYAVYARDEAYYICSAMLYAAPAVLLVLAAIGGMTLVSILFVLLFCAMGTSALHAGVHLQRVGTQPLDGAMRSITPLAWHDRESARFRTSKRIFDVAVALVALVLLAPLFAICMVAIAVESGRPIFFRQERVGENGRTFRIFKFRTMVREAGSDWAKPGDQRITRLGAMLRRTSLDELPQLFNVLRAEMSIVGPRPEMVAFAKEFSHTIEGYDQRHVVAPGITGWAQLYQKRNLDPSDIPVVAQYDFFYVEHASVLLDTALVLKTMAEFLFHRAV
jgi:lipopolysaccharide/colanic/teichoic acid biosynthesis glycosyltransferase